MEIRDHLAQLNSLTKYPSIPTYHAMGDRGRLDAGPTIFDGYDGPCVLTEKIDGTNARIVLPGNARYLIGSREDWLTARGDVIHNPAMGIVDTVRAIAHRLIGEVEIPSDTAVVFYGEVYGGNVGANAKQYSGGGTRGFRVFDVACVDRLSEKLRWDPAACAAWRDSGGQSFHTAAQLAAECIHLELDEVPAMGLAEATGLPTALDRTLAFLQEQLQYGTMAALDDGAKRMPEGIVIRSPDRSRIAKMRVEDYQRTLRAKNGAAKQAVPQA